MGLDCPEQTEACDRSESQLLRPMAAHRMGKMTSLGTDGTRRQLSTE